MPLSKITVANFKEKNSHLDQDSYPGLQLHAQALYQLSLPDEVLSQGRILPLI